MQNEPTLRKATLEDVDVIVKLRLKFLEELNPIEFAKDHQQILQQNRDYFFRKMSTNELETWFVLDKGNIVSVGSLLTNKMPPSFSHYAGGREGYFFNVYTLPEYRNRGLASLLTSNMIKETKKNKYKRIWLTYSGEKAKKIYANLNSSKNSNYCWRSLRRFARC